MTKPEGQCTIRRTHRRTLSKGVEKGCRPLALRKATTGTAIKPLKGWPQAGFRKVWHGRPQHYFKESMATPCHTPLGGRSKILTITLLINSNLSLKLPCRWLTPKPTIWPVRVWPQVGCRAYRGPHAYTFPVRLIVAMTLITSALILFTGWSSFE
jgi:hypothetical protein